MNPNESEVLNSMLCFSLYTCSREMTRTYRPLLEKLQITYSQYLVLLVLWSGNPRTVTEIGDALFLDSGTLTPLLKRLEEKGWLQRVRGKDDERVVNISLTQAGIALQAEAACIPTELADKIGLDAAEYNDLLSRLHALQLQLQMVNGKE